MQDRIGHWVAEIVAANADFGAEPPAWVQLLPAGAFTLRDGRGTYVAGNLDRLKQILAATLAHAGRTELMIDYDHQSAFAVNERVGGTATAAGWIKQLEARMDGIWARVEWTPSALAKLRAREYRYISPLFVSSPQNEVLHLLNAALVNRPAIDFPAIAAAFGGGRPNVDQTAVPSEPEGVIIEATALAERASAIMVARAATSHPVTLAQAVTIAAAAASASTESAPNRGGEATSQAIIDAALSFQAERAAIGEPVTFVRAVLTLKQREQDKREPQDDPERVVEAARRIQRDRSDAGLEEMRLSEAVVAARNELAGERGSAPEGQAQMIVRAALVLQKGARDEGREIGWLEAVAAAVEHAEGETAVAASLAGMGGWHNSPPSPLVAAAVDQAVFAGKVLEEHRTWAVNYATSNGVEDFSALIAKFPVLRSDAA